MASSHPRRHGRAWKAPEAATSAWKSPAVSQAWGCPVASDLAPNISWRRERSDLQDRHMGSASGEGRPPSISVWLPHGQLVSSVSYHHRHHCQPQDKAPGSRCSPHPPGDASLLRHLPPSTSGCPGKVHGDHRCEVTATPLLTPMAGKEKQDSSCQPMGSQDRAVNGSELLDTDGGQRAAKPSPRQPANRTATLLMVPPHAKNL